MTSANIFDYFLVSQQGRLGTSRPTHYFVLANDANLSKEQLHTFTFQLCHMYQRSTSLVSNVAPIYYADLAATQAHYMIADFRDDEIIQFDARSVGSHGSGSHASTAEFLGVSPKLAHKLFMA